MKLEVGNHEVRSSNELPGLPYVLQSQNDTSRHL